jgi:hypothetical protein
MFSLAMNLVSICLSVASAVLCLRLGSRYIRVLKRKPPSELTLAKLAVDQAELSSSVEKLATTLKRVNSRHAMQEHRSGRAASDPPPGTSKAELRRIYGLNGKTPAEIAAMHKGKSDVL